MLNYWTFSPKDLQSLESSIQLGRCNDFRVNFHLCHCKLWGKPSKKERTGKKSWYSTHDYAQGRLFLCYPSWLIKKWWTLDQQQNWKELGSLPLFFPLFLFLFSPISLPFSLEFCWWCQNIVCLLPSFLKTLETQWVTLNIALFVALSLFRLKYEIVNRLI